VLPSAPARAAEYRFEIMGLVFLDRTSVRFYLHLPSGGLYITLGNIELIKYYFQIYQSIFIVSGVKSLMDMEIH
jgi:hypothetical protein